MKSQIQTLLTISIIVAASYILREPTKQLISHLNDYSGTVWRKNDGKRLFNFGKREMGFEPTNFNLGNSPGRALASQSNRILDAFGDYTIGSTYEKQKYCD